MRITGILALFMLAVMACDTKEILPDEQSIGTDFYPLQVGDYSIFRVEAANYQVTGEVEVLNYELKTEVVDSFSNQGGTTSYIIYYSERSADTEPWKFIKAWQARKNGNQAILTEENIPYLKISFPVKEGKTWDGNALNTTEPDEYRMDSLFSTYITPEQDTFNNTLTVIQEDNQDFTVQFERRYEIYAVEKGLVYKEDIALKYCTANDCLGQQIVVSGHEYKQYLLEHGRN